MIHEISNLKSAIITSLVLCTSVMAGARFDLRPTPPIPPGGYQPGTDVRVDLYIVDTGNPQGNIASRGIFVDFSDSPPWGGEPGTLTYLDPDGPGFHNVGSFAFENPFTIGLIFSELPQTSWVYPLPTANPLFQITIPDNGEVLAGHLLVDVGTAGGILDAMNADAEGANSGARFDFGFGGAGDPVTTWRAFTGELTGGVLELPVVPEPASSLLLITGFLTTFLQRRVR